MLETSELRRAIADLEAKEPSLSICAKLADLYAVLDHIDPPWEYALSRSAAGEPPASAPLGVYGDTDFLRAVAGKDATSAWKIMDKLMDTIHVVNPRVYDSFMDKIKRL